MNRSVLKLPFATLMTAYVVLQPTRIDATSPSGWCGTCMSTCPSIWEYDALCHAICSQQSLGWCPGNSDLCGPWQERLDCQGDPM